MSTGINFPRPGSSNLNTSTNTTTGTNTTSGAKGSSGTRGAPTSRPKDTYTDKPTTPNAPISDTVKGNAPVPNAPVMSVAQLMAKVSQGFASTLPRISEAIQNVAAQVNAKVKTSAAEVQKAYDTGGPEAAAAELQKQTEALGGSPVAATALITAAGPTLDLIARDMASGTLDPTEGQAIVGSLSAVANKASDAGLKVLAGKLAAAAPTQAGTALDFFAASFAADTSHSGTTARLTLAVAGQLQASCNTAAMARIEQAGMLALTDLSTKYTDLKAEREKLDTQLQAELAELEGTLTPEQKAAYITEYQRQHKEVYDNEPLTAQLLEGAIKPNVAALNAIAQKGGDSAAGGVVMAMKALASSPMPAVAVEWAADVFTKGSLLQTTFGSCRADIQQGVIEKGMPGALIQFQAQAGGDAKAALKQMEALYGKFELAEGLFDSPEAAAEAIHSGHAYLEAMAAAEKGDRSKLQELLSNPEELDKLSFFGTGMAMAGLAFGMANIHNAQDLGEFVKGVASASEAGLTLVVQTIGSLSESGKLAKILGKEAMENAVGFASFLSEKLIPAIGLGLNAVSTLESFQTLLQEGGAGNLVSLIGNATSTVGSLVTLFPPAAPLGELLEVAGMVITFIGELLTAGEKAEKLNQEQQDILEKIFSSPNLSPDWLVKDPDAQKRVASQLARSPFRTPELMAQHGLSRDQVLRLANTLDRFTDINLMYVMEVLDSAGLQGQGFVNELTRVEGEQGENEAVDFVLSVVGNLGTLPAGSQERQDQALRLAEMMGIRGPNVPA